MRILAGAVLITILAFRVHAQDGFSTENLGADIILPTVEVRLGIGFNYDLLRDPFDISFEYPRGYFGLNLPLEKSVNVRDYSGYINPAVDSLFADSTVFTNGDEFRPTAGARQNPNPSIMVDIPMLGGVASFSSTQNVYINYQNVLGNSNIFINPDSLMEGLSLLMRGDISAPVNLTATWETMTFGYAFEVNRYLKLALSLHRHVFVFDLRGKIDTDLLVRFKAEMGAEGASEYEMTNLDGEFDYSSDQFGGTAYGHYEAEVWTPTIGFKTWRFSLVSRFGLQTKARGSLYAKYALPSLIDPVTFQPKYDFNKLSIDNSLEMFQDLSNGASDSIIYSTKKKVGNREVESDLEWKMPTGLTLSFDIVPEKFKISYTKLFGEVSMRLDRIAREQTPLETTAERDEGIDSIVIDYGVQVDNVIMLEVNLFHSFLNLGVFGLDVRYGDQKHLLGRNMPSYLKLGDAAMIPVLSLGTALGTRIQLLLEMDILPLPALKTGVFYYF
jgi:hypothetical protein